MAEIYVYDKSCEDFTNFGLCGALTPTSCIFEEEANGMSEITLEHPIDDFGRFNALAYDNLLVVEVPVRTTPEIRNNAIVTTVEKWTVKPEAQLTKTNRTIYKKLKKGKPSGKLKVIPGGTSVTVVEKSSDTEDYYKIKSSYGDGWIKAASLIYETTETIEDKSQSIESVQPAWTVKPQVFRIYSVEKDIDTIKVSARHISYDLLYNLTTYVNTGTVACYDALAGIMDNTVAEHDFNAYTNLADTRVGFDWTRVNPINALLDPDDGLTTRYAAALVRDNWNLYVLHDPGLNRGVTVEYAKNMTGLECTESTEDVVTRIIPVGQDKDGNDLLLDGTLWVDSPHINDYPVPHIQELKTDIKAASKKAADIALAREQMKAQAQAVFDEGGDVPEVEMSVDFVTLGDTAEYAQYKDLDRLFLWDYVIVRHKKLGLDVTARVASIKWDCISGRMESMEIGKVGKTLANSGITSWQIPSGFSGSKIASGTVDGRVLASDIISTRHVQSESISTEALQTGSVTADKINATDISAQSATLTDLQAAIAKVTAAYIQKLESGSITSDELAAQLLRVSGYATIDNLVADGADINNLIVKDTTATKVFIKQLQLLSAQMARATVGELVIKASDGKYYKLDVTNGAMSYTEVTLTDDEITAGVTSDGRSSIIETSLTVDDLSAGNLKAINALIDHITADRLDVNTLMARQAFINALYTSNIYGGKSLKLLTFHDSSVPPTASEVYEGYRWLDTGVEPNLMRTWKGTAATPSGATNDPSRTYSESVDGTYSSEKSSYAITLDNAKGQITSDVTLSFEESGSTMSLVVINGTSYTVTLTDGIGSMAFTPEVDTTYTIYSSTPANASYTCSGWETINDTASISEKADEAYAKSQYLEVRDDGTHLKAVGTINEMVLTNEGLHIDVNGQQYSKFAASYVQFGNYRMYETNDGGLAFKLVKAGQ